MRPVRRCRKHDPVAGLPAGRPGPGGEIGVPVRDGVRRALVTGASAGIGRACAGELHAAGWAVTAASRRGGRAGLLAKRLLPFRAFEAAAKSSLGV